MGPESMICKKEAPVDSCEKPFTCEPINPDLYKSEDIHSLAIGVAVYVQLFSDEPFDEPWECIEGEFDPSDNNQLVGFIEEVLRNPKGLEVNGNERSQEMKFGNICVSTRYALPFVVNAYASGLNDKESVLVVGNNGESYRLSDGDRIPESLPINPESIMRFVNFNPSVVRSVGDEIIEEIGHYIPVDEYAKLLPFIQNVRTGYLGEIGVLSKNEGSFRIKSLREYMNKFRTNLPSQVIYFTKEGTGIEQGGRIEKTKQNMLKLFNMAYHQSQKLNNVDRLVFQDPNNVNQKTIIYIFNRKDES